MENQITIRVRNEFFDELLKEIDKEAVLVHYRNVSTQDVSKEFVDLESRLNTKREVEARYIEILRKKAGTIKELLDAEQKIGALHEEIEATIRRINFLREQVSYSTINLEFYQQLKGGFAAKEENSQGEEFTKAFHTGLDFLVHTGLVLVTIWPLISIGLIVLSILLLRRKKLSLH